MKTSSPAATHALPHADDELMSVTEVATLVRVPVTAVRYWRHLATGPHGFCVGRSVRYWRSDAIHWLDEQPRHPQTSS